MLQKVRTTDILNGKTEAKSNNPKKHISHVHVMIFHREIKGRLRKRVVLANAPSFRCLFRKNMRTYPRSGFSFRGNIRTYPRSGFRSRGTSAKTTLLETTLLGSSEFYRLLHKFLVTAFSGLIPFTAGKYTRILAFWTRRNKSIHIHIHENSEHHRLKLDTHTSPLFSGIYILRNRNTNT